MDQTDCGCQLSPHVLDLLDHRGDCRDGSCLSYKLHPYGKFDGPQQYGMDAVVYSSDPGVDEGEMSFILHFADGNRRDGVGDLLNVEGIDTSRHRLNPISLFDHGKQVALPIGFTETRDTREYTVFIDPVSRSAKAKVFVYQGKGMDGVEPGRDYDHALFCEQIFDMWAKRLIRAGSIGYQVIEAEELPQDWRRGIPKGLLLNKVLMLEASAVVLPANGDTVRKALSMPKCCGKPLSPYLVKALKPYAVKKARMGWEPGRMGTKGDEQVHRYEEWERIAKQRGAKIEPDGTGRIVAHIDGDPIGTWDPKYGGAGYGWFDERGVKGLSTSSKYYITKVDVGFAVFERSSNKRVWPAGIEGQNWEQCEQWVDQHEAHKSYADDPTESRQDWDNPLTNTDVPNAKWKPGHGTVKNLRKKYGIGKRTKSLPWRPGRHDPKETTATVPGHDFEVRRSGSNWVLRDNDEIVYESDSYMMCVGRAEMIASNSSSGKSIRRKDWDGFRTRAMQAVQRAAPEQMQNLQVMLEQYWVGDIRIEELLSEFPMLTGLAAREGIKSLVRSKGFSKTVRVHRRGQPPEVTAELEVATEGPDGRLYVRDEEDGRWWMLSRGNSGWHSINVGISDPKLVAELDKREGKSLPAEDEKILSPDERNRLNEARSVLSKPPSYQTIAGMDRDTARRVVNELEAKVRRPGPRIRQIAGNTIKDLRSKYKAMSAVSETSGGAFRGPARKTKGIKRVVIDLSGMTAEQGRQLANFLGGIGHGTAPEQWDRGANRFLKLSVVETGDSEYQSSLDQDIADAKRQLGIKSLRMQTKGGDFTYRSFEVVEGKINGHDGFNVFAGMTWIGGAKTKDDAKRIADREAERRIARLEQELERTSVKGDIDRINGRIAALGKKSLGFGTKAYTVKVGVDRGDGEGVVKLVKKAGGKASIIKRDESGDWLEITAERDVIEMASDYAGGFVGSTKRFAKAFKDATLTVETNNNGKVYEWKIRGTDGKARAGNANGKQTVEQLKDELSSDFGEIEVVVGWQMGVKSLKDLRSKYKNGSTKGLLRRVRKSAPGAAVMDIDEENMDAAKEMCAGKGIKFHRVGASRVKLVGQDDQIDEVAKSFAIRVKHLAKALNWKRETSGDKEWYEIRYTYKKTGRPMTVIILPVASGKWKVQTWGDRGWDYHSTHDSLEKAKQAVEPMIQNSIEGRGGF